MRYPWERWEDGQSHEVLQGRDYFCSHKSMVTAVHRRGVRIGKHGMARLNEPEDGLYIQFATIYTEEYMRSHPDSPYAREFRRKLDEEQGR